MAFPENPPPTLLQLAYRRARKAEADNADLRRQLAEAIARVDGVDFREGHWRDNCTPDELREVILGLAIQLATARAEGMEAAAQLVKSATFYGEPSPDAIQCFYVDAIRLRATQDKCETCGGSGHIEPAITLGGESIPILRIPCPACQPNEGAE